ncbi:MAG: aconitase X catalytic domain-containing protein [Nitrososphaerales archaeon]
MYLDSAHEKLLRGEGGEARRLAMEIQAKVGDAVGAESLVPIKSAHVQADYIGLHDSGIELFERFVASGGSFGVPTTVNPASIDFENWESLGVSAEFARSQIRLCDAIYRLGGIRCWTCVPYQVCNFPKAGETVAWAEPSSVVFANSIIGCRTNKAMAGMDVACAILGLTPKFGMLLDEDRVAEVAFMVPSGSFSDLDYRSLGRLIGKGSGSRVPALVGVPKDVTSDDLKHLGAAAASAGPLSMIHYVGITSGSSSLEEAAGGEKIERIDVSRSDLEAVEGELNQTEEAPDLVALGAPHLSVFELGSLAGLLEGHKVKQGIELCAYTSHQAYDMASRAGIRADIEAAGGTLSRGTDADVSPLRAMGFLVVLTNSALLAETLLADGAIKVRYASLRDIIREVSV